MSRTLKTTIGICDGFNFLLPTSLIAEIVSGVNASTVTTPQIWQRGVLAWHGIDIPVINFEQIVLGRHGRIRGSHIAVIKGTADTETLPFYGLPTQAQPNDYALAEDTEMAEEPIPVKFSHIASMVRLRGVRCIIPKLSDIEAQIAADIRAISLVQ